MKSNSTVNRRPLEYNLFSLIFISVFTLGIITITLLLYPRQLPQDVIFFNKPEPITEIYLQQLAQTYPNNTNYLIALTEQNIGLHHYESANHWLDVLIQDETQKDQVSRLQFLYTFTKTFELPKGSDRNQAIQMLVRLYSSLLDLDLTSNQFLELGNIGLKLEVPQLALIAYEKGIALQGKKTSALYREIASTALQSSQYRIAAHYDLLASQLESNIDLKREDIIQALKAYQAGNLMSEGLPIIQQLPESIINNAAMLEFLAQYALAAGRPDLANAFMKRALLDKGLTP